jgi:hypothetical protein
VWGNARPYLQAISTEGSTRRSMNEIGNVRVENLHCKRISLGEGVHRGKLRKAAESIRRRHKMPRNV